MLDTLRTPKRVFSTNCKGESKLPTAGSFALQVARDVLIIRLQLVNTEDRTNWRGSNNIENTPDPFVVALETTVPSPHCNCTRASMTNDNQNIST